MHGQDLHSFGYTLVTKDKDGKQIILTGVQAKSSGFLMFVKGYFEGEPLFFFVLPLEGGGSGEIVYIVLPDGTKLALGLANFSYAWLSNTNINGGHLLTKESVEFIKFCICDPLTYLKARVIYFIKESQNSYTFMNHSIDMKKVSIEFTQKMAACSKRCIEIT